MSRTPETSAAAKRSSLFAHPIGFWFFFWGEFAERCCYYGVVTILMLYMTRILHFEDSRALVVFNCYQTACYLLPLLGGFIADRFLGKYHTIVYFAVPYLIGQLILCVVGLQTAIFLYIALFLLAMGSGVIKPNISTLMGLTYDQLRPGETKLRSDAFAMYYAAINIGSALSGLCVPAIRTAFGADSRAYTIAFMFPAVLMIVALVLFVVGKPFYAKENTVWTPPTPQQRHERWVILRRLLGLFLVVAIFWSIFNQSASTWVLFTRDYLRLELFGLRISPDQLMAFNPVMIIVLLPLVTMCWHVLSHFGWDLKPTTKMIIGFLLTTVTAVVVTVAAFRGASVALANAPSALASAEKSHVALVGLPPLPSAGPETAAQTTVRTIADESLAAARLAWQTTAQPQVSQEAIAALYKAGDATKAAATSCSDAIRTVEEAAEKAKEATSQELSVDLTGCGQVATAGAATAAYVKRSADALAAGNPNVARQQAAMTVAAANETTLLAVQQAASVTNIDVGPVVKAAEQSMAAGRISLLWQVIPYIVVTIAEICISVVGLELAFAAAPATMKSFVTACWLMTISVGNVLNASVAPYYNETVHGISLTPNWYFLWFAVLMIPVTLAFTLIARRFSRPAV